jgi:hypothetical protein
LLFLRLQLSRELERVKLELLKALEIANNIDNENKQVCASASDRPHSSWASIITLRYSNPSILTCFFHCDAVNLNPLRTGIIDQIAETMKSMQADHEREREVCSTVAFVSRFFQSSLA